MKTKLFALFLALAASVGTMFAKTKIGDLYYNLYSTTAEVTYQSLLSTSNYSGLTTADIPASVTYKGETYSVTSIGEYAFCYCSSLTSVTIPISVRSIGKYAFQYCSGLTSLTIPNSVTSIGASAFNGCRGLTSVTIGNSVTSIGNFAFDNCRISEICYKGSIEDWYAKSWSPGEMSSKYILYIGDTKVENCIIPNSVTSIGGYAFSGCSSLTSVTLHESVTSIGGSAFRGCIGLTSVTIPNSVTSIGGYAFYGCSGLTSVTIPESVTSIGNGAFKDCSGLTSVTLNSKAIVGNNYDYSGEYMYSICYIFGTDVTEYVLGDKITRIGRLAFHNCSGLTSVTIGNSVTSIGEYAFNDCSSLTKVNISDLSAWCKISFSSNPLYYAHHLFLNDKEITDLVIPNSVTSIGEDAFYGCSGLTSVTIPNSVTSIGNYAFNGCSGLTSVTIPNSVTSIGGSAFSGCSSLTKVNISDLSAWCTISFSSAAANPLYYAHHLFLNDKEITDLVIPNSVTSIGGYAFYGCSGLTSLTIPNSVTSIGKSAFSNCGNITSVVWNAKNCNSYNFGSQVENFTFGNAVEVIPESLCSGMSKLISIVLPNSVTSIGESAFSNCGNITSVVWNAKNCNSYNFGSQVENFTFGNAVEVIPGSLCSGMSKLTSIVLPNSVTSIGASAFNGCSSLDTLSLGEDITGYGDNAFAGCPKITAIYNYRERPSKLGTDVFKDVDYFNCTLYVPAGSVEMYKSSSSDWKDFFFIEAISAALPTYTITFMDWDGTELQSSPVEEGTLPVYTGETPERAEDEQYTYTFSGWTPAIVAATADATYTATYDATAKLNALDDINATALPQKLLRNGQLLILRGDKTYTVQGQEVR